MPQDRPGAVAGSWPNGAQAAISVTIDNMGEAADINRKLWPASSPIGKHFTVTETIPQILELLQKYDISATYFIESWNIEIYGDVILQKIAAAGHEIGWHAWQHENWSKLNCADEKANFERSFGPCGIGRWTSQGIIPRYRGFRPPGGIINGQRTLKLAHEAGLTYISPAGKRAAIVKLEDSYDTLTILPFRWATVDAYYYMETFAGLRKMKGDYSETPQSPRTLVQRFVKEINETILKGGFMTVLFHPFLTNSLERLQAMDQVLDYLAKKRDEGIVWIAPCQQVQSHIENNPGLASSDPGLDLSVWR